MYAAGNMLITPSVLPSYYSVREILEKIFPGLFYGSVIIEPQRYRITLRWWLINNESVRRKTKMET
jgi:hypothetical protein